MDQYESYTSNLNKLMLTLINLGRLPEIKKDIFRPITLQFALTDNCNLNCDFCSNKQREGNEFTFEEIKNILNVFKTLGCKSVEFTGGEPTLHPQINEIITYAKINEYSIGLKSNGIDLKKHLSKDSIVNLEWLRISLNSLDYVDEEKLEFNDIYKYTTFGFSYVFHDYSKMNILKKLKEFKNKFNAKYMRIIPDNSYNDVTLNELRESITRHPLFKSNDFFWHDKIYSIPEKCWMMWLKPFINTDKNIYHCCAVQMFQRKHISKYRLCSTDTNDIIRTWAKTHSFSGKMCNGGKCYYTPQNNFIRNILCEYDHSDFI